MLDRKVGSQEIQNKLSESDSKVWVRGSKLFRIQSVDSGME